MADPDLQDKGGGEPDHLYPEIMEGGGAASEKDFFRPFGRQFGIKIRGGGEGVPFPWIRLCRRKIEKVKFRELALLQSQSGDCELELCYWWEQTKQE